MTSGRCDAPTRNVGPAGRERPAGSFHHLGGSARKRFAPRDGGVWSGRTEDVLRVRESGRTTEHQECAHDREDERVDRLYRGGGGGDERLAGVGPASVG